MLPGVRLGFELGEPLRSLIGWVVGQFALDPKQAFPPGVDLGQQG
jgi:hypothetical protein